MHHQLHTVPRRSVRCDVVWWWFFSPGGAYDSVWDSVKPMDIPHQLFPVPRGRWVCMLAEFLFSSNDEICPDNYNYQEDVVCVCMLNGWSAALTNLSRQLQLLPVQVEGQGSQCRWTMSLLCSSMGAVRGLTGWLFRAVYTGARPGVSPAIRAEKGWRGLRELAPWRSATRISCAVMVHRHIFHVRTVRTTTTTTTTPLRGPAAVSWRRGLVPSGLTF